ncbi:hypothetical protein Tco_0992967 [Tanacetum coccineum]|uniref:PiggyBac transposable element-derived protein domain-containing protein n=1 Tax=Tanacetum coccineum TaxID=301880 RepID=A0ABQ5F3L1_9ASTR
MARRPLHWKVAQDMNHKKFFNGGVIVVEDDHDIIHDNNSFDLALSTSLNDLDFETLNIDANFDEEVLANDDDDDVAMTMSAAVARCHGSGDDPSRPPPRLIGTGVGGRKATSRGRGGGRDGGSKGTRKETRNLGLKKVMNGYGPPKIRSNFNDKGTMLHLDENAARWSNLIGELGIEQHFAKVYVDNKSYLKKTYWSVTPGEMRDVADIRSRPPLNVGHAQWDSSTTHEYLSLISTFFDTNTYEGVFTQDKARVQYEEMLRQRDLGANTPLCVPYTKEEIMAMFRKASSWGTFPGLIGFWPERVRPPSLSTSLEVRTLTPRLMRLKKRLNGRRIYDIFSEEGSLERHRMSRNAYAALSPTGRDRGGQRVGVAVGGDERDRLGG